MIPPRLIACAAAGLALVSGVLWFSHVRYKAGEAAGTAKVTEQWQADTKARDAADAAIRAQNAAAVEAARQTNQEALADANTQLQAIAADRDSLARRMSDTANRVRTLASAAATSQLGTDVAAGIARRAEEAYRGIEERWDAYDKSCQRDAVRFSALQDQIRPQL
jgi:DNA anti-recombination protein RmuC